MPRVAWRGRFLVRGRGRTYDTSLSRLRRRARCPPTAGLKTVSQTPFLLPTTRQGNGLRAMSDQEPTPKTSQAELPAEDDKELERSTSSLARENNDEEAAADTSGTTTSDDPPTRLDDTCTTEDHNKVRRSAVSSTFRKKGVSTGGGGGGSRASFDL